MAGATMSDGMAVLQPLLLDAPQVQQGTVVLGTVQGDLHDIGKNIVKTLLYAAGFTVHDIGVDQPSLALWKPRVHTRPTSWRSPRCSRPPCRIWLAWSRRCTKPAWAAASR